MLACVISIVADPEIGVHAKRGKINSIAIRNKSQREMKVISVNLAGILVGFVGLLGGVWGYRRMCRRGDDGEVSHIAHSSRTQQLHA